MNRRAMYFFAFMVCGAATLGLFVARGPEPSDSMLRHRVGRIRTLWSEIRSKEREKESIYDRYVVEPQVWINIYESLGLKEDSPAIVELRKEQQARANWSSALQQEIDGLEAELEKVRDETAVAKAEQEDLVRRRAVYTGAAFFTGIISATFLILFMAIKNPQDI